MGGTLSSQDAGAKSRKIMRFRRWLIILLALSLLAVSGGLWMLSNARAMPMVRRAEFALPFPADAPRRPVTIALLTDTHLSGPDGSPERMARIVSMINGLRPDLVALGGDYIGDWKGGAVYGPEESIAAFATLKAPLGVVAVLGNHDAGHEGQIAVAQWRDLFSRLGIVLLDNQAVPRGPLAIGGLRDRTAGKPDAPGTLRQMEKMGGAPVLLAHRPDVFPDLPAASLLALVGHTHCGQVALPLLGIVYVPSRYGTRYACGLYHDGAKDMIVSAGVGTSGLPIRMLSPPDIWLVTIRPR